MADQSDILVYTADIVSAFVENNRVNADELAGLITSTHAALAKLADPGSAADIAETPETFEPAVTARKSLGSKDHIISMIDGKPYKTLRRHLSTHGLTPEDYRARYKLPDTYPMVAETYSAARREMARKIGLGRKPGTKVVARKARKKTSTS